jgi:hypothetical protein
MQTSKVIPFNTGDVVISKFEFSFKTPTLYKVLYSLKASVMTGAEIEVSALNNQSSNQSLLLRRDTMFKFWLQPGDVLEKNNLQIGITKIWYSDSLEYIVCRAVPMVGKFKNWNDIKFETKRSIIYPIADISEDFKFIKNIR